MDEDKLAKQTSRASQAEGLLNSELLNEAFASLESSYVEMWKSSKVEDANAREKLFLAINIIGKVKQHLQTIVNDGKLAAHQLRELAQAAERSKAWHEV